MRAHSAAFQRRRKGAVLAVQVQGQPLKRLKKHAPTTFGAKAGKNAVRLARKHLKPGRYRITATPSGGKP
jgi:hypothetical protein